jgi:flagellar biosynthesis GTPase FlhF
MVTKGQKSFIGENLSLLLEQVKLDCGDEVIILSNKKGKDGKYEVIIQEEITEVNVHTEIRKEIIPEIKTISVPIEHTLQNHLIEYGFAESLVNQLGEQSLENLEEVLRTIVPVNEELVIDTKYIAFLGFPGSGITSLSFKLATTLTRSCGYSVGIISLGDSLTNSTIESIKNILPDINCVSISLQTVSNRGFHEALNCLESCDLVILDLPTKNDSEVARAKELLSLVNNIIKIVAIDTRHHLSNIKHYCQKLKTFEPNQIAFTFCDLSRSLGAAISLVIAENLPLSLISTGVSITEDLEPATWSRLWWIIKQQFMLSELEVAV